MAGRILWTKANRLNLIFEYSGLQKKLNTQVCKITVVLKPQFAPILSHKIGACQAFFNNLFFVCDCKTTPFFDFFLYNRTHENATIHS